MDVKLDGWELEPGDQIPHFMEHAIHKNDHVLIVCTQAYKEKSDNRAGGVGYESNIISAEVLEKANHKKFIPVLKSGEMDEAIPNSLKGKYYIDLSDEKKYRINYPDLLTTLLGTRKKAPPIGSMPEHIKKPTEAHSQTNEAIEEMVKIEGIIVDEVAQPLNDGTFRSALYEIPFRLNQTPMHPWPELFVKAWNHPPQWTSMHRPGIASVIGDRIILDGTTIEEVESYHKDTLRLAVDVANKDFQEYLRRKKLEKERQKRQGEEHKRNIKNISERIKFD